MNSIHPIVVNATITIRLSLFTTTTTTTDNLKMLLEWLIAWWNPRGSFLGMHCVDFTCLSYTLLVLTSQVSQFLCFTLSLSLIGIMGWFWFLFLNRIYQSPLLLSLYKFYKALLRLTTHTTEIYRISNSTAQRLGWYQDDHDDDDDETMEKEHDTVPLLKRRPSLPDIEDAADMIPADAVYRIGIEDDAFLVISMHWYPYPSDRSILYSKVLEASYHDKERKAIHDWRIHV